MDVPVDCGEPLAVTLQEAMDLREGGGCQRSWWDKIGNYAHTIPIYEILKNKENILK